jgi:hypothetical protein
MTFVSATSAPGRLLSKALERISRPNCEPLYATKTSTVNRKHFFMNIICIKSICPQRTHNRTSLFGSILLKHDRHSDYWNQLLNMSMLVCYLDSHEAGLCCFLVTHIRRKPITSITAVLLPVVTYLLTLSHNREVPGSNIDPELVILTYLSWFFAISPVKCQSTVSCKIMTIPFSWLTVHYSLIFLSFKLVSELSKVPLNMPRINSIHLKA